MATKSTSMKLGGAVGYYYKTGFNDYRLFVVGNGDMFNNAYSESVLQEKAVSTIFMTRLS